ncbi:MAG TPA: chemotaxis protein CheW [Ilumatobacteraceae bacterium]|nr:chemotaxis protein CheW [Ilumatobacteraceae bacterium]
MSTALDRRYCTFLLGGLYFGVPVTKVQEVLRAQERTRIPLVSAVIDGLINLRGEIVTTLDLRRRLELPPRDDSAEAMNVVIRSDDGVVSLLVDEIRDVLDVEDADFEPVPPTLSGPCRDLVTAIFKLDDSLLLILDTERLLEIRDTTDQREVHHS